MSDALPPPPSQPPPSSGHGSGVPLAGVLLIALAAFLLGIVMATGVWWVSTRSDATVAEGTAPSAVTPAAPDDQETPRADQVQPATLTVASDGCGVIRTEFDRDPRNLAWSVVDAEGFEVLQRNALGETRYRYFRGGTYTVRLVAWNGVAYAPVSNVVEITC